MKQGIDNGLLGDGILGGMGVSVLVHGAVLFLLLSVPWAFPCRQTSLPLCTVSLLAAPEAEGGSEAGKEGSMSKGNGEPEPSRGAENIPAASLAEAVTETAQEEPDVVRAPDVVEDAVPVAPVPKKVEKPVEKPKFRPKPKSVPKPPRTQQTIARAATLPPSVPPAIPKTAAESPGGSDDTGGGHGEGSGMGSAGGTGKGGSGDGPGAGSGVGAGGGGLLDTSFGSGDGPGFVTRTLPKYPGNARKMGKEGAVLLRVTIDERGRVVEVEVLKRAGLGFDEEAVRAVRESSFRPAKRNGKPVACRAHLPIRFVLAGSGSS